jgi:hypothetical protein
MASAVTPLNAALPLESRSTIVLAPLAVAAVVLALATVPVETFEPLIALTAEPSPLNVPVIVPAENSPDDPRRTIVEAPLAVAAVVLAFATVPEVRLDALIAVKDTPLPEIELAVISPAPKLPDESRRTIVAAPLAEAAVVLALAIVPDEILEALIEVRVVPAPIKFAAVTFPAVNAPLASRATIVLALFEVLAVVLALSKVPEVTLEALIAVKATPLPDTLVNEPVVPLKVVALEVVAVMTFAVKFPFASRATMVDAPFDELAVV